MEETGEDPPGGGRQYRATRDGAAPVALSREGLYGSELRAEERMPLRITATPVAE
jgi:hypothetical protein